MERKGSNEAWKGPLKQTLFEPAAGSIDPWRFPVCREVPAAEHRIPVLGQPCERVEPHKPGAGIRVLYQPPLERVASIDSELQVADNVLSPTRLHEGREKLKAPGVSGPRRRLIVPGAPRTESGKVDGAKGQARNRIPREDTLSEWFQCPQRHLLQPHRHIVPQPERSFRMRASAFDRIPLLGQ